MDRHKQNMNVPEAQALLQDSEADSDGERLTRYFHPILSPRGGEMTNDRHLSCV